MCGRQPCTKTFSAYSSMVTFSKHPKHAGTENSTAWMADDCFSVLPHASTDCCMVEVWWILRGFSLVWTPKPPVWHGCSTDRSQQISQSKRSTAALINLYTSKLCWKWWRCDGFYVDLLFLLSTGTAQKTKNSTSWIFLGWLICALPTHRLRKQHFTDGRLVFAVLTHTGTESSTSRVAGWY